MILLSKDGSRFTLFVLLLLVIVLLSACHGSNSNSANTPLLQTELPSSDLGIPQNVQLIPGQNRIVIQWSPVGGAQDYNIYWSEISDFELLSATKITAVQSGYIHSGLSIDITYYYRVSAVADDLEGQASTLVGIKPVGLVIAGLLVDQNLQACINALATTNQWVTADAVTGTLQCNNRGITDLTGLEKFVFLSNIDLANNAIANITPLFSLNKIFSLDVSNNNIVSPFIWDKQSINSFKNLNSVKLAGNVDILCSDIARLKLDLGELLSDISLALDGVNCTENIDNQPPSKPEPSSSVAIQYWPTRVEAFSGNSQISVHWQAAIQADSYNMYWSQVAGVDSISATLISEVSSPFIHRGLNNSENYNYIVTAVFNGVESQYSEEVSATPSDQGTAITGLFVDSNLQACVSQRASLYSWVFAREIAGDLDCSSQGISDLSGLEQLVNLRSLNLRSNLIVDISALSTLIQLERLVISDNQITSLDPISSLSSIRLLNLRNNKIFNLNALSSLTTLEFIYLDANSIIDVSPLASLVNLQELELSGNNIGGRNVGKIDSLIGLVEARNILLADNPAIACEELILLVRNLGEKVVDISTIIGTSRCAIAPDIPQLVTASAGNSRNILQWSPSFGALDYRVYWATSPGVTTTSASVPWQGIIFIHENLANGIKYFYIVTAVNNAGESLPSIEVSATPTQVELTGLFSDPALQGCMDEIAEIKNWLYATDVIDHVNCSLLAIKDLTGIERLTEVSGLLFNENAITDITPLLLLPSLKVLSLRNNKIRSVRAINVMTGLTELTLSGNLISNVLPISSLFNLQKLALDNNNIGSRGKAYVDTLTLLTNILDIKLIGNPDIDCSELVSVKTGLPGVISDIPIVVDGTNCRDLSIVPKNFRAVASEGLVTLTWSSIPTIFNYTIYWSTLPGVSAVNSSLVSVSGDKYIHNGVSNGVTYFYRITTALDGINSALSNEVIATPSLGGTLIDGLILDQKLNVCLQDLVSSRVYSEDVVGDLNCSASGIGSLVGLEYFTNIQSIRLGSNSIVDPTSLGNLGRLVFLDLFKNSIKDISGLSNLISVQQLFLHSNLIEDISALSNLGQLNYLILDQNRIIDINPISNANLLTKLFIRSNLITDVSALSSLTQLLEVYANNNEIIDVSPLSNIVGLQKLDLRNNRIGGLGIGKLDSLLGLSNVTQVWLSGNVTMSCSELESLLLGLGPAAIDISSPQSGVNCTFP